MLYGHFIRGTRLALAYHGERINKRRTAVRTQHPKVACRSQGGTRAFTALPSLLHTSRNGVTNVQSYVYEARTRGYASPRAA
jgi:hypothetical protein